MKAARNRRWLREGADRAERPRVRATRQEVAEGQPKAYDAAALDLEGAPLLELLPADTEIHFTAEDVESCGVIADLERDGILRVGEWGIEDERYD